MSEGLSNIITRDHSSLIADAMDVLIELKIAVVVSARCYRRCYRRCLLSSLLLRLPLLLLLAVATGPSWLDVAVPIIASHLHFRCEQLHRRKILTSILVASVSASCFSCTRVQPTP